MTFSTVTTLETDVLTERTRATWTAGDFGQIARSYEPGAAEFISRLNLRHGEQVLDVACGTGNLTIPAARAGAKVTGLDIAPNLLEQAQGWADSEGLDVELQEGNAEQLPFANATFDTLVTMFGAMFAARPELVAGELLRVTRPGGRIVMANWTPNGFIGQMFKIVGKYVTPAPGVPSPLLWGDTATVAERLGGGASHLQTIERTITFEFPFDPAETVDCFRIYYGPTVRGFATLSPAAQDALRNELAEIWAAHNQATDGTTRVDSTYLEVTAIRQ